VNRIFLTLSMVSNVALAGTYILGWTVRDPRVSGSTGVDLSVHFLSGVAALALAMFVHAIVLTYFMGTGRWIEETSAAYKLGVEAREQNIRLKYRVLPGMVGCFVLWIVVGGLGAASDPAASLDLPAAKIIHMSLATLALLANVAVCFTEYQAIQQNSDHIDEIMARVTAIRRERGLDVDDSQRVAAPRSDDQVR
jgi:hypothetical protein